MGVLPVLNQMFDIVTTRTMAGQIHPPEILFVMLAVMAFVSAFPAGHGMSGSKVRSWVHSIGFAGILAATVLSSWIWNFRGWDSSAWIPLIRSWWTCARA